jgi:hypothetical protein
MKPASNARRFNSVVGFYTVLAKALIVVRLSSQQFYQALAGGLPITEDAFDHGSAAVR